MIKEKHKLGRVIIADNGYNGCMYLIDEGEGIKAMVEVLQREEWLEGDMIKKKTRRGYITGSVEDIADINWIPGQTTGGKVVITQSYDPPVPEYPEELLLYENGKPKKINNRYVYQIQYYSFNATEPDIILE